MSTIKSSAESLTLNADGSGNDIIIQSNASTLVTVDGATGNVGVGEASPAQRLEVTGLNQTGFAGIRINNPNGNVGSAGIEFQVDGTYSKAAIFQKRGHPNGGGDLIFAVDSSTDAANWVAGDEKLRLLKGGGITFNGDTAAANALDDYEEGTWTPVYSGSTTAGSYSMTHLKGIYTKIGNLVTVSASAFNVTQSSAGAGDIRILGLPFVVSLSSLLNNTFRGNVGALELDTWTFTGTSLSCTASAGNSYVNFRTSKTGVADVVLQAGSQGAANNSDFGFSITYRTDS